MSYEKAQNTAKMGPDFSKSATDFGTSIIHILSHSITYTSLQQVVKILLDEAKIGPEIRQNR